MFSAIHIQMQKTANQLHIIRPFLYFVVFWFRSPVKPKIVGKQKKGSKSDWLSSGKKEDLEESLTGNLDATKTSKVRQHGYKPTVLNLLRLADHLINFDMDRGLSLKIVLLADFENRRPVSAITPFLLPDCSAGITSQHP